MKDSTTRSLLARAHTELRYLEAGGESVFRSVDEARTEIHRLSVQHEAEQRQARAARRAELRGLLIDADVERSAAWCRAREADAQYARLRDEAGRLDIELERDAVTA
jgi:hypothetical protein